MAVYLAIKGKRSGTEICLSIGVTPTLTRMIGIAHSTAVSDYTTISGNLRNNALPEAYNEIIFHYYYY